MHGNDEIRKAAAAAAQDEQSIDRVVTAVALIATVALILLSPLG